MWDCDWFQVMEVIFTAVRIRSRNPIIQLVNSNR